MQKIINKDLSLFSKRLLLTLAVFIIVSLSFSLYIRTEKQIDRANELRFQSFLLADELRQSSDDLTLMARNYVVTAAPRYKQHFQEILDIHNGKKPRPIHYNYIYWDLVLKDDHRPVPNGPTIALQELMQRARFNQAELAKLSEAKVNFDKLNQVELVAMALIEPGKPITETNHRKALELLFNDSYFKAKAEVMRPIKEFYEMMDQRTLQAVHTAEQMAVLMRAVFILVSLLLILALWLVYRALHHTLGYSVNELHQLITRLGSGDFSIPISVSKGMENSVVGWLAETRSNLAQLEAERKQAEIELEKYRDNLTQLVKERTAQLVNAVEAAEAANIAKSTFIATMSHELRTPLNAILGFSELLERDTNTTAEQKEKLVIINHSGAHLLSMINDVLDISKIEAGRLELEIQAFDLLKLLHDIADMTKVRAAAKQLSFSLSIASDINQYIKADAGKLRQVLINLLTNAIKFTQQGGIILKAYSKPQPGNALMIVLGIEVIDSGAGISSTHYEDVFTPFLQLTQPGSEVKGTGLGLAISKSLVTLMGGHISVTSILEVGSTFKVELPAAIANSDDIVIEKNGNPVKSIAANQPEWRLLVVDDNNDNRKLLSTVLSKAGFQVREAENGQEAVTLFEQWRPHLIWMDMRMPVMDGYEATVKIRHLVGGHTVKIIALTASAFKEQHAGILTAGCDAVLHKPFHIEEIFAALASHLGVKFTYSVPSVSSTSIPVKLTAAMLSKLPFELSQHLHEAALNLDIEKTDLLITKIRSLAPDVATGLQELAERYEFEQIIRLIETAFPPEMGDRTNLSANDKRP